MNEFMRQSIVRPLWMKWEKGFGLLSRLRSTYTSEFGICKVMVRKHRGDSIECLDGTRIQEGDWIGELHLDNAKVLELLQSKGSDRAALRVARMASDSMEQIARAMEERPEMSRVKALVGITLLHRGITHGLGFELHSMKSGLFERLSTSYLRLLLSVMHPEGAGRIDRRKERLVPMMLVHTRDSLKKRFLPVAERNDSEPLKPNRKKILILSGSLGDGHKQAARALAEAALEGGQDVQVEVVDYMEWTHPRLHTVGKFLFEQWVTKLPSLYGYLFWMTRGDNSFSDLVKGMRSYRMKRMVELLRNVQPTVVVSTFPPAAAAMSMMKVQGLTELPTVTVITDHTDHNFWIHPYTDRYIVGSEPVRRALMRKRIPPTSIEVTGIPISARYGGSFDRNLLRERHRLDSSLPTVLVMGGGLGMIDKAFVERLKKLQSPAGVQFIVVCGHNRKLEQELNEPAEPDGQAGNRVLVTGYIDYVHELMAASDFIVTKPGGLSTSEALALELPMLLYKPLPGQEKDNSSYLAGTGAAIEAGDEEELMLHMVRLLEQPSLLGSMKLRASMYRPEAPSRNALQAILRTRTAAVPAWEEYAQPAYAEA